MVNASLNWASIVGIVLAVGGALLYFMRSFKPALARDYDVFFAAVGLLCGGILFFQGWRLDPILQFGQFLLAGTTVFFAYESVRLRGVTTEQARRSSYFDDDEPLPARGRVGGGEWQGETDRFDEPQPLRRRIRSRPAEPEDDEFYRPRRAARPAIPEQAASRRASPTDDDWDRSPRSPREGDFPPSRSPGFGGGAAGGSVPGGVSRSGPTFGARRRDREAGSEPRRGSRPVPSSESVPRSSRRSEPIGGAPAAGAGGIPGVPQGTPLRTRSGRDPVPPAADAGVSDADYTPVRAGPGGPQSGKPSSSGPRSSSRPIPPAATGEPSSRPRPRDNSSRFDD